MNETADTIRKQANVLVVIGIGGSYLGAKAVIEALSSYFSNDQDFEVLFAGHQVSGAYLKELLAYINDKEVAVQCHLEIRHNDRAGDCFSFSSAIYGRTIW